MLAADQGGFFPRSWPWAALALAAAAALAILAGVEVRLSRPAVVLVSGLAALAGWTVLSVAWSSEPQASLQESMRTPVYVAAALALSVLASAGEAAALLTGLVAATTAIGGYSLVDRVLHGPHLADQQSVFLERPLGYANALGIFCALGIVVLVGLAVPARTWATAGAALGSGAVLGTALVLSQSRASWAACTLGVGVAIAVRTSKRRLAIGAASVGAFALASLSVLAAAEIPTQLQERGGYWHVAWQIAARHPLLGTGAGTFDLGWATFGDLARWGETLDAHNLYLETWAELGAVGLAALLASLLVPVAAALRRVGAARVPAAALGGATAFLFHAGFDWDWEMPAVTVAGLVCIAACLDGGGLSARGDSRVRGGALALALLTAGAYLGYLLHAATLS